MALLYEGRLILGSTILDIFLINSWGGRLIRGSAYSRVRAVIFLYVKLPTATDVYGTSKMRLL